ncbi:MAG: hypothetical protein ACR2FY_26400 [Pirellulaceae bacterium]
MGEIRVKVILINSFDDALLSLGKITPDQVRRVEAEGIVDTGAVTCVLPQRVVDQLGVTIQRVAKYADGRSETVGVTGPVLFEILGRNSAEDALVLGDEILIGQTLLERLDLLADCRNQKVIPNPVHPDQQILNVR